MQCSARMTRRCVVVRGLFFSFLWKNAEFFPGGRFGGGGGGLCDGRNFRWGGGERVWYEGLGMVGLVGLMGLGLYEVRGAEGQGGREEEGQGVVTY